MALWRFGHGQDSLKNCGRLASRALYVFYAWGNNTDARAGNTFDTIVEDNGIRAVRHLIDFGSALGSDGNTVFLRGMPVIYQLYACYDPNLRPT